MDQMDAQLHARDAGDAFAVRRLRRLHWAGMACNAVLLLAFVVFLLVKGMNALREAAEKKKEEAPAAPAPTPEDIALLREIRDLMKNQPKA